MLRVLPGAQPTGSAQLDKLVESTKKVVREKGAIRSDKKRASEATIRSTEQTLVTAVARIWNMGFHISDVKQVNTRHCYALVHNWLENGYSIGTVVNNLCRLRALGRWIGKPDLVPMDASRKWIGLDEGRSINNERKTNTQRKKSIGDRSSTIG